MERDLIPKRFFLFFLKKIKTTNGYDARKDDF